MGEIFLYNHGGSANHGCEALVRSICILMQQKNKIKLLSEAPQQDFHYGLQEVADIQPGMQAYSKLNVDFLQAYFQLKKSRDYFPMDILPYRKSIKSLKKGEVEISVGGDIYCYDDYPKFIKLHELISKKGCKSILLGCSLEKQLFDDPLFVEDMKRYDYISARESLTYQLLKDNGLTNIGLNPDSAFTLPAEYLPLPEGFVENNTIGLNVSPLVIRKESRKGIVYDNFVYMMQWILENTECAIALIPHVVWEDNDDRTVLRELYNKFKNTGRVVLIDDCNCMQLKGYISRCRFFVGARTHATIAAYSTGVPTLVLGYSIKSRGIAKDLFGTEKNYVISVQDLREKENLFEAFRWIFEHEHEIKGHLEKVMDEYVERARNIKNIIRSIG